MLVITPTSGSAIAASSAIWPDAAHRHLEHEHLRARRRAEDRQRQPDLGVEVRVRGDDAQLRREHRGEQVLRRRLAGRAGDADHLRRRAPAATRARARRARPAGRRRRSRAPRVAERPSPRARARPARPTRRPRSAAAAYAPPSTCSPGSPTNRSPGPAARESIDRPLRARSPRAAAGSQRAAAPAACGDPLRRSSSRAPQRLARDGDVVERHLAPAGELLALLVALAGDHHDVARRRASATARSIAARRSARCTTSAPRDRRPAISAMIASGSSERGLSEVTIATSASSRGDPPHQRALAAVAVAAGAEHADHPARARAARAARSTFSSESGVCA